MGSHRIWKCLVWTPKISFSNKSHESMLLINSRFAFKVCNQLQLTRDNSKSGWEQNKIVGGNDRLSYRICSSIGFALKGPVREFDVKNVLTRVFMELKFSYV